MTQLAWIFGILSALVGVLAVLRMGQKRLGLHPEVSRKAAHIAMGLSTLAFPWIFHERWPVVLLAALAAGILWGVRAIPSLRSSLGETLGAVKRASLGELLFPLAVALVFCFTLEDKKAPAGLPVLYLVPVLVLTLADAFGALIGVGYGRYRYRTDDGVKSAEGSVAFFGVAFLCCHALLLLGTNLGRAETLLIALHMAMLVAIMEALSWNGLDNLFVPLGAYVLLRMFVGMEAWDLFVRLVAMLILLLALLFWRRRTYLQGNALPGVALALYSIWFLGGGLWIWPALALWISYTALCPREDLRAAREHNAQALVAVVCAPICWLLLNGLASVESFLPYVLSLAGHTSLIFYAHLHGVNVSRVDSGRPRLPAGWLSGLAGLLLICLPYLSGWIFCPVWPDAAGLYSPGLPAWTAGFGRELGLRVGACLLSSFGAVFLFWLWQFRPGRPQLCAGRWFRQGIIPFLLSLLGAALAL